MKQALPSLGFRFNRAQSLALTLLGLSVLFLPPLIHLAGKSTDTTFVDNRKPMQAPNILKLIREGKSFRGDTNKYLANSFGLRAEFVKLNALVHYKMGMSSIPALVVGKDGWIFLKKDHEVFDQFRGLNKFTNTDLDSWIDTMEQYRAWMEEKGIVFMIVVAPNQQTAYPEYMPSYANRVSPETRLDQLIRRLGERNSKLNLVDLRPSIWAAREKYGAKLLYHKYENHWNSLGAFVGYTAMMKEIKTQFPAVSPLVETDFAVTEVLHSWDIPPLSEMEPSFSPLKPSNITGTKIFDSHGHGAQAITFTKLSDKPSLLFYGDSFGGDPFGNDGMLPFIKESFKSTIVAETNWTKFPVELIKNNNPNVVVFELVERYLARPLDLDSEVEQFTLSKNALPIKTLLRQSGNEIGGYVDDVKLQNNQIYLNGWGVDIKNHSPADAIYVYAGDKVIGACVPTLGRPDIAAGMKSNLAGFNVGIRANITIRLNDKIRIFSINKSGSSYQIIIPQNLLNKFKELVKETAHPLSKL